MDKIPTGRSRSARSRPSSSARSNINNVNSYLFNTDNIIAKTRPQSARELKNEYYTIPQPQTTERKYNHTNQNNEYSLASSNSESKQYTLDTNEKKNLNDPLLVLRPYTPEILELKKQQLAFLPKSITDPLIINYDEPNQYRYKKPLICPEEYLINSQKPHIFEKNAFTTIPDYSTKVKLCRNFIERNRDRLWKIDVINHYNKTPRTICNEIVNDPHYLNRMIKNHTKEGILKNNNSDKIQSIMIDKHEYKTIPQDPFLMNTLNTSRDERKNSIEKLLKPELHYTYHNKKYNRGYNHAIDFGNFAKYNGILKSNKATTISR